MAVWKRPFRDGAAAAGPPRLRGPLPPAAHGAQASRLVTLEESVQCTFALRRLQPASRWSWPA